GSEVPARNSPTKGSAEAPHAKGAHRRRPDCPGGGRSPSARGDRGHRPAQETRTAARALRHAPPAGRPARQGRLAGGPRGDRPADSRDRAARGGPVSKPLLVIDGDSLAHRAYHALPKTFRRAEGRPGNALLGFSNFLVRLWEGEQPRAVLVGWDSLDSPTDRHVPFAGYERAREFDDDLLEQLDLLPELGRAFGS